MAEVAGLALGVVGLAGVIGAFKDVIDLFSLFLDSRHLGRDFEVLDTKLDIAKALLLQCADRVRLVRRNHASQLDNPDTRATIYRALGSIQSLLRDADALKSRYGFEAMDQNEELSSSRWIRRGAISAIQMTHFTREFDKMDLRINSLQERSGIFKQRHKIRWAIRDKKSFETLLSQLAHFITRLSNLIPATNLSYATATDAISDSGLQASLGLRDLKIVLEVSQGTRQAVADSARRAIDRTCQDKILQKLWFRTITSREESIGHAHDKTLQWLFEPPKDEVPWDDLGEWFRTSSGLYWVSGKAGSGKSTLMKLLYHNPRTKAALSTWAGHSGYELFGFFFWSMGAAEQKSQQGLSRSLLYQILSKKMSLIPEVLPSMWKELIEKETDVSLPSPSEARLAFQILSRKLTELGKFCFLIAGLDEFSGDYRDGIAFIKELIANPGFKVLVSSRPIPDCDVIVGHRYMLKLMVRHRTEALALVEELVEKSSGVFLWVILACRSLLSGFSDYDRISELKERMDELPPELEEMFKLMLNRINVRHRGQGAGLLRLCFEFRKYGVGEMSAMGLALADDSQDFVAYHRLLSIQERRELCEKLAGRLRSRCGGLLELTQRRNLRPGPLDRHKPCFCGASKGSQHEPIVDGRVEFMHRTVFEFLDSEGVWEFDCLRTKQSYPSIASELSLYGLLVAVQCLWLGDERRALIYLWQGLDWGRIAQMDFHSSGTGHFSHATLMLAVEAGAINYAKVHPDLPTLVKSDTRELPSCGCDSVWPLIGGDNVSRRFRPEHMAQPDDSRLARARVNDFLRAFASGLETESSEYRDASGRENDGCDGETSDSDRENDGSDGETSNSDKQDEIELELAETSSNAEAIIPSSPESASHGQQGGNNSRRRRRDYDTSGGSTLPKRQRRG
ncbi:Prion-inhibition and propagation domain containing protein [Rhypophila sp. PSN 637]